ncbi:MAG TPA: hypothetical protein VGW34_09605 [Allosphingosinicella sp.]|nr:hypothetical protein [Allosphingosinicella sp.]
MGIEVIDGTVAEATPQRVTGKLAIYKTIAFRLADGSERRLAKMVVAPSVAAMLEPGVSGRFYGYSAIDHKGLFGARTSDGRADFQVPSGNERTMIIMAVAGAAAFAITLVTRNAIMLLGAILGVLGAVGYVRYRRTRLEARARYDADAGYAQGLAAAADPERTIS